MSSPPGSMPQRSGRFPRRLPIVVTTAAALFSAVASSSLSEPAFAAVRPVTINGIRIDDSLQGRSGKLRARILAPGQAKGIRIVQELFGEVVIERPGIYTTGAIMQTGPEFAFISMLPFSAKVGGRIGDYRLGSWPRERARIEDMPQGFVEVTEDNKETRLSEHFRIADFLTHD